MRLDEHHVLAASLTVGNLTVWPIRTDRPLDLGEFLTLDEAVAKGVAEVREVGAPAEEAQARVPSQQQEEVQTLDLEEGLTLQEAAVVNTLVIENRGDLPILVCAGTVVKGGNQDRQIGQDVVLKAKTTTPVDAFCVEQGRWQGDRLGQDTGGKFQVLDGVATAKVRAKGQYEKDQGGVWEEVRLIFNTTVLPQSSSYAVAFDAKAEASAKELEACEEAVRKHFAAHGDAVGFAYAVNGKPVAVRTFAHPRLLAKQLDGFARGMATEALLARPQKGEATPAARAEDVAALVRGIASAEERIEPTRAANANGFRESDAAFHGICYVPDKDGRQVAVTRDWTAK